jgi:PTS system nitrogen regulatory IIA component
MPATVNALAVSIAPSRVFLDVDASSKKRLFEHIALAVENDSRIARVHVFDALFAREKLGSTGLGLGVAIPHGRLKALREVIAVFVRTKEAIAFDAPDGEPVRLVFAMLAPENANERHLQLLSELAQMFGDEDLRNKLLSAPGAAEAHALISEWTPYAGTDRPATV